MQGWRIMYGLFRLDGNGVVESFVKACISGSRLLRWFGFRAYIKPGNGFRRLP